MSTKVITPEAILSYPHLFRPQPAMRGQEGQPEKFSAVFVFEEGTDITPLKKAAVEAAAEKWGDKAKGMIQKGQLRMPFRTDVEEKGYPEGSTFVSARTTKKPGIVSTVPDPETGKPMPITDEEQIYPGAIVRASLVAFAYDVSGNRGVSFALNNIQKLRDGERLDGRVKAEDEFDADEDAVADLSDLTDEGETAEESSDDLDLAELLQ